MKIIIPYGDKLVFDGKEISQYQSRSSLLTWGGDYIKITPECRGIKLTQLEIHPITTGTNTFIVTEESYFKCLNDIINNEKHKKIFDDILSKYDIEEVSESFAFCFDELLRETMARCIINN